MRRVVVMMGALALGGCASSTKYEREAHQHDLRADAAAQLRDYDRAAAEKAEAARLHRKALKRAYQEGSSSAVVPLPPEQVPHEPPPPNTP
jgi:hypothetical protein